MGATGRTHKSWSAGQQRKGANTLDGPGQLEPLAFQLRADWREGRGLRHREQRVPSSRQMREFALTATTSRPAGGAVDEVGPLWRR